MRGSRVVLGLAGAMALGPFVVAEQPPIYGCRTAISCRPGPLSGSALNDKGSGSVLFGARFSWGPGFHVGLVMPLIGSLEREPAPVVDAQMFHLGGVSLWPPPPAPTPTPPATPAPAGSATALPPP